MNAGSSVTRPVFVRRFAMSMARSFSVPTTTGASNDVASVTLLSSFSLTVRRIVPRVGAVKGWRRSSRRFHPGPVSGQKALHGRDELARRERLLQERLAADEPGTRGW